jgi:hypothetical protein
MLLHTFVEVVLLVWVDWGAHVDGCFGDVKSELSGFVS